MANMLLSGGISLVANTVGERIKERRKARGWTLTKLADVANTSHGYLSDVENNKVSAPASAILARIAEALDTSADYLLCLTDDPTPANKRRKLTPEEQLAEMGLTGVWARGGDITQEDVEFFRKYLETQRRIREEKNDSR